MLNASLIALNIKKTLIKNELRIGLEIGGFISIWLGRTIKRLTTSDVEIIIHEILKSQ